MHNAGIEGRKPDFFFLFPRRSPTCSRSWNVSQKLLGWNREVLPAGSSKPGRPTSCRRPLTSSGVQSVARRSVQSAECLRTKKKTKLLMDGVDGNEDEDGGGNGGEAAQPDASVWNVSNVLLPIKSFTISNKSTNRLIVTISMTISHYRCSL